MQWLWLLRAIDTAVASASASCRSMRGLVRTQPQASVYQMRLCSLQWLRFLRVTAVAVASAVASCRSMRGLVRVQPQAGAYKV